MISYTLVSLINHDVESFDCGNYVSNIFDANTGIWWYCYDDITQFSGLPKRVYIRESHKKRKSDVRINRCVICGLYQKNPSDKIQLDFFQ